MLLLEILQWLLWKHWPPRCRVKGKGKKVDIATLFLDKTDCIASSISRDKEGPPIMVKGSLLQRLKQFKT